MKIQNTRIVKILKNIPCAEPETDDDPATDVARLEWPDSEPNDLDDDPATGVARLEWLDSEPNDVSLRVEV